jgi:hypothetical protein
VSEAVRIGPDLRITAYPRHRRTEEY